MLTDQKDVLFARIKGIIDRACIKCKNTSEIKTDIKMRSSQFISVSNKKLIKLIVKCAEMQYRTDMLFKLLNVELVEQALSYGEILSHMQRVSEIKGDNNVSIL